MDYLKKDNAFEITLSDRKLDHFENETKMIIQKNLYQNQTIMKKEEFINDLDLDLHYIF